ncbi:ABC transporter [Microthyrium microscopicum]|uniref:ABC transporter n=1 Tax=Microthyrium microscopicum TaxID=703497 RepID=A0A6A6UM25_9PEZI|nr:ABC transporter [Microthyrium microscopicum]
MNRQLDSCFSDNSFGPTVQGCRGDFDFTLRFEHVFFSIVPAICFWGVASFRIGLLARNSERILGGAFQILKITIISIYTAIQLALLILTSQAPIFAHNSAVVSAAFAFVSGFFIAILSYFEHSKSLRTSLLLSSYLLLTILFEAAQSRTLLIISTSWPIGRLYAAAVGVKVSILLLECRSKLRWEISPPKERSLETSMNLFSLLSYAWLKRLFVLGNRKLLDVDDLLLLDDTMTPDKLDFEFWDEWIKPSRRGRKARLALALLKALGWRFWLPTIPRLTRVAFDFCQPLLINQVQSFLLSSNPPARNGKALIGAAVLIYSGQTISITVGRYYGARNVAMLRGYLVSGIFRKTTILKLGSDEHKSSLTLMSTDVERCRMGFFMVLDSWTNVIEFALAAWLLQRQLGIAFLVPIGVVLLCFIGTLVIGRLTPKYNRNWVTATQRRVGSTANVIANMKSLKISGLSLQLKDVIHKMRQKEIRAGNIFRWTIVISVVFGFGPAIVSPVLTFAATNRDVDSTRAFTSLSYLSLMLQPLSQLFQVIPMLLATLTCLDRIAAYLEAEPWTEYRRFESRSSISSEEQHGEKPDCLEKTNGYDPAIHESHNSQAAFSIRNGSFAWNDAKRAFHDINLTIPAAQLTMVVGPVGSGKSTLCKTLLGEIPIAQGEVVCNLKRNSIGFCDQIPFLPNASIKDVILGCTEFDADWYNKVLSSTDLLSDIKTFENGDLTKIGPSGSTLSGGQKHRIAIARAIYARPEALVFDDIFSGLDGPTEQIIFQRVFSRGGLLQKLGSTVILCTHAVKHLPYADHIIALGSDGTILEQGSFSDLSSNNGYVQSLQVQSGVSSDAQAFDESERSPEPLTATAESKQHLDDRRRQLGDVTVYKIYLSTIGPIMILTWIIAVLAFGATDNFSTVWLEFWSTYTTNHPGDRSKQAYYLGIYALIKGISLVAVCLGVALVELVMVAKSGETFHIKAIQTVIAAPLSLFTSTPPGVILNRFSQDLNIVDSELPMSLNNLAFTGSICIGMAAVVAIASPYLAVSYPILLGLLYLLQKYYLRTSRQLRYLDLETKSPLFTHYLETLAGLPTLRAFGWMPSLLSINQQLMDGSQRSIFSLAIVQEALVATLYWANAILAVLVVTLATQLRVSAGFTGVALVSLMQFGLMLAAIIRSWTMLEISIGAVSRLESFTKTIKSEHLDGETQEPPENWPQTGSVEIRNVSAAYTKDFEDCGTKKDEKSDDRLALRDITLSIAPGEKVGIVGRTGSGKSSLILLLLRLIDPLPGSDWTITIDGIALETLNRDRVRSCIIALPQDTFFLPDGHSYQENLDPYNNSTPQDGREALETVGLWPLVEERGGIDTAMNEEHLSQGQKQLFSVARAILRAKTRSKEGATGGVLLLDEVTSSVDGATDVLIQEILRKEFASYSIIAVAHRLETLRDFDRVVVMENGGIKEIRDPKVNNGEF